MRRLLEAVEALKSLVRTGWSQSAVPHAMGETVAAHSFEASVIALAIAAEARALGVRVSPERAAAIAVVHDLGEAVTGDLPPWTKGRCSRMEEAASILGLPGEVADMVGEFESGEGLEALVARVADLLATAAQGARYASLGYRRAGEIGAACMREADELSKGVDWLQSILRERFRWLAEELREFDVPSGGWFD